MTTAGSYPTSSPQLTAPSTTRTVDVRNEGTTTTASCVATATTRETRITRPCPCAAGPGTPSATPTVIAARPITRMAVW